MHPILFHYGPIELHSYGLLLAIAFVVGIQLAMREGRRRGLPEERLASLSIWVLVLAVVGARLAFVLSHTDSYAGRWSDALHIWEGGLTMYGGLLAALAGALLLLRRWGLPVAAVFDAFAPSVALGEGITRVGCFLNGCCFGRPCALPWAVPAAWSHARGVYPGQLVHPTQLYLSLAGFLIFATLWLLRRRIRAPGRLFFLFLLLECVVRFLVDLARFYEPRGESIAVLGVHLSLTQALCIGLLLVAVVGLLRSGPRATGSAGAG